MSTVVIENIEAESNVLRGEVRFSPDLRRFFSGKDFVTRYSVDITDVPESILTIPVLAHVCPVAWMQNADVYSPVMDRTFLKSLQGVQRGLNRLYPELIQGGELHYKELVDDGPEAGSDENGLFFTGGVDSMFSYVRHRDDSPSLINVQGWTVRLDDHETWNEVTEYVEGFANDHDVDAHYVCSNMLDFLRNVMLIAYSDPYVSGAWYSSVGHGLGLPGLCAPLAYERGIGNLYISPSQWEGISQPWGTRPEIVDNVRWSGTEVRLEGYEYSRQERLETVAEYAKTNEPDLKLVTCSERVSENCGRCEKCCRTAVGLLLAGLDPNDHGYRFSSETLAYIRNQFQEDGWEFRKDEQVHHWEDIQDHASIDETPLEGSREFLQWLREADFDEYAENDRMSFENQFIYPVYRNTPWQVFNTLSRFTSVGPFGVD